LVIDELRRLNLRSDSFMTATSLEIPAEDSDRSFRASADLNFLAFRDGIINPKLLADKAE
jgi:hypothetical protein